MVGDGAVVAGDGGWGLVEVVQEVGQGSGDVGLVGSFEGDGDGGGGVGDGAGESSDDGFAGDGAVFVVVAQVGVQGVGEVVFGVGGQQPQGQLQAAAAGVQEGALGVGVQVVAGDLGAVGLLRGGGIGQGLFGGLDGVVGGGQAGVLGGRVQGGVGEQVGQGGLGGGQGGLGRWAAPLFPDT